MMLDWLGLGDAAQRVRESVEKTLASGVGTPDLGGSTSTTEMTDHIIGHMS